MLSLLVALMFGSLTTRLWYLQVLASAKAKEAVQNNSVRLIPVEAPRGRIFDSTGRVVLVQNRMSLEIQVSQQQLGENPEEELLRLSEVTKVPIAHIANALRDKRYYAYQPIPVAVDVDPSVAYYIGEHQDEFPGVAVVEASVREYPNGTLAAHVLGSTGLIGSDELEQKAFEGYGQSDIIGRSGVEAVYERFLRGTTGLDKYLVDSSGEIVRSLGSQPPAVGNDLVLSLDLKIQRYAEESLAEGILKARGIFDDSTNKNLHANAGAVVVMDPNDGSVKALASYPTFDPSWFIQGLTNQQDLYLQNEFLAPQLNRAVQSAYAPGSTFKPFTALAAVHNGIATLGGSYGCPAEYIYPGDTSGTVFHNWDPSNNGYIGIDRALQISCDTVFYQFGGKFYSQWANDPLAKSSEPFQRDLRGFGFSKETEIDLPSEAAGLIPTAAWKEAFAAKHPELYRPDERHWLPGDDILMAIGQGSVQVSPLQLAAAYSAVANGGHLCEPRLADHIQTEAGALVRNLPKDCHRTLPYSKVELDYVRSALATVTQGSGTAAFAFSGFPLSQVPVAGKTGTAERPGFDAGQDTSWFAAMVPAGDPKYVIVVMVEQGGHGSTTAAPIVRQIIEKMYGIDPSGFVSGGVSD